MSAECPLLLRLVASSVSIANRAGQIIRDVMACGKLNIIEKDKNDYQTEADRLSEKCIVGSLRHRFPNIAVIGEENISYNDLPTELLVHDSDDSVLKLQCPVEYLSTPEKDFVIWVDPLDGTGDFTRGLLEHVTVLIGIAIRGVPVAGVMHQPYYEKTNQRTLWGIVGCGTGGFTPVLPPDDQLIIVTTSSHYNRRTKKSLDILKPTNVIRVGGAGFKILLLLEGKAHSYIYVREGCKRWDTCAPEAILRAVGGKLTDVYGNSYDYGQSVNPMNSNGIFATTQNTDHGGLLQKLPEVIKTHL